MSLPKRAARPGRAVAVVAALLGLTALAGAPARGQGADVEQGVFLRLASYAPKSYESVLQNLRAALAAGGLTVLADYEAGVNRTRCAYRARVLVAQWPAYAAAVVRDGARGAFAAPLRLSVFEDEAGVKVVAVNPRSLNRTIVVEEGRDAEWARLTAQLEAVVHARLPGTTTEYGQVRERGRIGKTMGVMAGGPFEGKIKDVLTVPAGTEGVRGVARQLYDGLARQAAAGEWKLRPVYLQDLAPKEVVVVGITGEPMEAKSFDIVGAGAEAGRRVMACPGIDHAAAYPLELVLVQEGQTVHIQTVDDMFRMKMYFEDAGMMAFAKNMGMPGSIGGELRQKLAAALAPAT